jgi:hypothetical protein
MDDLDEGLDLLAEARRVISRVARGPLARTLA